MTRLDPDPLTVDELPPPSDNQETRPRRRVVTQETVDLLRGMGASDDTVEFAQRQVPVYSEADKDRHIRAGLTIGFVLGFPLGALLVGAIAMWVIQAFPA